MRPRLTISFEPEEYEALQRLASADFRSPREQLRWLLRQEAERRGLMTTDGSSQGRSGSLGR